MSGGSTSSTSNTSTSGGSSSSSSSSTGNPLLSFVTRFNDAHERLKHNVHSYWRKNTYLSPRSTAGKVFMSVVYFSMPVVVGYYVSNYAVSISEATVQERLGGTGGKIINDNNCRTDSIDGSNIDTTVENITATRRSLGGDKILVGQDGRVEKIGAGGWGGGVHLVTSDQQTQDVNRINLERFLKKQQREKLKREKRILQKQQQEENQEQVEQQQ